MSDVFLSLLNRSIAAGWLVLAVLLLRPALKRAPKSFRCILWGLVGIRLICPFSLESKLSLIPSVQPLPRDIPYAQMPAIDSGVEALDRVVNTTVMQSLTPQAEASVNPIQIWLALASALWLLGVAVLILYSLFSYRKLRKSVHASLSVGDNVYICDYISTPFILGIIKPKIYLPSFLSPEDAALVLAHEKAHLKRRDHWWKPLGYGLLTVYWFHPLIWAAYLLLCRDIELACDEKVIREFSVPDKKAYSNALLSCSVPRFRIAACPLAFGESAVKERIKTVLDYKKPGFWIILTAVAACVLAAVCFLTDPKDESPGAFEDVHVDASVPDEIADIPEDTPALTGETLPLSDEDTWDKTSGPSRVYWGDQTSYYLPEGWKLAMATGIWRGIRSDHVIYDTGFCLVDGEQGQITVQYVDLFYYDNIFLPIIENGFYTSAYVPIPPITTGISYTPSGSEVWEYITIAGLSGVCIIHNEGTDQWWSEYGKEVMKILSTFDMPFCRISREDICHIAENHWQDLEHDRIYAELNTKEVCWMVTAYLDDAVVDSMCLDHIGNFLPHHNHT